MERKNVNSNIWNRKSKQPSHPSQDIKSVQPQSNQTHHIPVVLRFLLPIVPLSHDPAKKETKAKDPTDHIIPKEIYDTDRRYRIEMELRNVKHVFTNKNCGYKYKIGESCMNDNP